MPKDIKSTNELVLRDFLDKMIGDEKLPAGQDQMQESMSPLDFVPYERLGALGVNAISSAAKSQALKKLMGDDVVHNILGNEIGAVGRNIKPKELPIDDSIPARPDEYLYHVTHKKNIPSILKKGLEPRIGQITENAHDIDSGGLPGIFFNKNPKSFLGDSDPSDYATFRVKAGDHDIYHYDGNGVQNLGKDYFENEGLEDVRAMGMEPNNHYSLSPIKNPELVDNQTFEPIQSIEKSSKNKFSNVKKKLSR